MLSITIEAKELFDESVGEHGKIITTREEILLLEHSLVSLSKWESLYEKPFLSNDTKTTEEVIEYIKLMTVAPPSSIDVYDRLSEANFAEIDKYIGAKMTAAKFSEVPGTSKSSGEFITSEIIYYWMFSQGIPMECQYWHLSKLIAMVKVVNLKNAPAKKMSRRDVAARNKTLNEQRRAQMGTSG